MFLDIFSKYAIIMVVLTVWRIIMADNIIREPMQKRSIEKKEKIIKYGFD